MNKRIKGGGKLSRKILAILMASGMLSSGAFANDVYVEQIGDNAIVSITQTGSGNVVNGNVGGLGNVDDPALILGDLNDVTISQIGVGNIASIIINNPGTGTTVVVSADGSSNTQTIGCGTALSASCNATGTISSQIIGDSNNTVQMLTGGVVKSTIAINGNWNNVTHTASGAGLHSGEITVSGSGASGAPNAVTLTQSGAYTKNAVITSNGSNNNVLVVQSD
jgi:hypothetical protein